MRPLLRLALAACLTAFPLAGRADLLQLANGDRLQGHLVAKESGIIRWESPVLGVLNVPEEKASIVADSRKAESTKPAAATATAATTAAATPHATAKAGPKTRWQTKIESGFALKSGRGDRLDINFRAESNLKRQRNSYRAIGRYLYSKANGATTTDRTEASFRWRRELDQRWFGQTNSSYLSAKVKGIDHNLEQNLGLGYQFLKSGKANASFGGGLTGQYRQIHDAGDGQSLFGEVFQDFALKINDHFDIGQDFTAQYSPSGRNIRLLPNGGIQIIDTAVTNYKLALNAFLRGKLTQALSLALRYEYEYDNTYVNESERADQRITTSLGYSF